MSQNWKYSPNRGENKKYLKPPPSSPNLGWILFFNQISETTTSKKGVSNKNPIHNITPLNTQGNYLPRLVAILTTYEFAFIKGSQTKPASFFLEITFCFSWPLLVKVVCQGHDNYPSMEKNHPSRIL